MAIRLWVTLALAVTLIAAPGTTQVPPPGSSVAPPAKIPAAAFASQNLIRNPTISPDGQRIALRAAINGVVTLVVIDAVSKQPVYRVAIAAKDNELEWFRWAGNDRVLLSASTVGRLFDEEVRFTRLYVADVPAKTISFVGKTSQGIVGDDVVYTDPAGQFVLVSIQQTIMDWPSVWRFPLDGTAQKTGAVVQRQRNGVWDWVADNVGTVRMGIEFAGPKLVKVWYRSAASEDFRMIAKLGEGDNPGKLWDIARIVSGSDEGYVLDKADNGRIALRKFNYATRTAGEVVFGNPDWDIDEATIDLSGKPTAAYYTDDRDRVEWLDPAMRRIQTRLEAAVPGSQVWVTSRARNDSRMLVFVGGESDPGAVYIYTPAQHTLDIYAEMRPAIDPRLLVAPRAISYQARDKVQMRGYLTLPRGRPPHALPLIILPHGGPYGVRDRLTYDDEVQFLANRGYAVLQPNFRGSAGYGEAFRTLGDGQIGRNMQDDIDDAMDWAVKEGIADPARVCVVGSSYGGYAALWAVTRNPERYRCAASFAGVTDWNAQLRYDRNFFTRSGRKKWATRVRGSDGTFDLDSVSPAKQVARLTRPVLLAHGDKDSNVPFSQFKKMRDAAQRASVPIETLVLPKVGHGFDDPKDEERWYTTLEAFLARHNPADTPPATH